MIFRISKQEPSASNKQLCIKLKFGSWLSSFLSRKKFHAKQMFVLSGFMKLGPGHCFGAFEMSSRNVQCPIRITGYPKPRKKCLGALALSKTKHDKV